MNTWTPNTPHTKPPRFEPVLVHIQEEALKIAYFDDIWWNDDHTPIHAEVTHWMQLPEPPKL